MRKTLIYLLVATLVLAPATASLAAPSYGVRIDSTIYSPGSVITITITAPTADLYTVEILKGSVTLMTLPESESSVTMEVVVPISWEDGKDYMVRAGRGSDIASVGFEVSSKPVNVTYSLSIDKTSVRINDTLILSGTSNISNASAQYVISASTGGSAQKTGAVVIANNKFECFIAIDSTYSVGAYTVKVGIDNVFSNICAFTVLASDGSSGAGSSGDGGNQGGGGGFDGSSPGGGLVIGDSEDDDDDIDAPDDIDTPDDTGETNSGEQAVPANPFIDVPEGEWYYDDVLWAYENGLMLGTDTDEFSPDITLTRAMIVTILWRLEDSPDMEQASSFADVEPDTWYETAVLWAADKGIVYGYGGGLFGSEDPVTRQDLAVILMRYMNYKEVSIPVTMQWIIFADESEIAGYAMDALQTLYKLGIMQGIGGNVMNPRGNATRAETAAILHRFLTLIG